MSYTAEFARTEPTRAAVDALPGTVLLEFGAPWCPHCQAAQAPLAEVLAGRGALRHLKIEDGKGRPLGRSFRVKFWPTLILLRAGQELGRVVRPRSVAEVESLFSFAG